MNIDLSDAEISLCIGCLEYGIRDLKEGQDASLRLGSPLPNFAELLSGMNDLRSKLRDAVGQSPQAEESK